MVRASAGGRGLTRETGLRETEGLTLDPRRVPLVSPKWPTGPGGSSTQILRAKQNNCEFNFTEITLVTVCVCVCVGNSVHSSWQQRVPARK